jgi:hypothetical protein
MGSMEKHIHHHALMIVLLLVGIVLMVKIADSRETKLLIAALTSFFYVGNGILHHVKSHDVTTKIVVEYVLIGSLGLTVVFFFLQLS